MPMGARPVEDRTRRPPLRRQGRLSVPTLVWWGCGIAVFWQFGLAPIASAEEFEVPAGDVTRLIDAIQAANDEENNPGRDVIALGGPVAQLPTSAASPEQIGLPAQPIDRGGTFTLSPTADDRIPFEADGHNGLPSVTSEITIQGNGAVIERAASLACELDETLTSDEFRIFHVAEPGGNLVLENVTVTNGCADGNTLVAAAVGRDDQPQTGKASKLTVLR